MQTVSVCPKRVMIVESDQATAQAIGRLVRRVDPEAVVECLPRASWARTQIANRGGEYALIVSDMELSNQEKGTDLYDFCRTHYPGIPFVLLSALGPAALKLLEGRLSPTPVMLRKACEPDEYTRLLKKLLSA